MLIRDEFLANADSEDEGSDNDDDKNDESNDSNRDSSFFLCFLSCVMVSAIYLFATIRCSCQTNELKPNVDMVFSKNLKIDEKIW